MPPHAHARTHGLPSASGLWRARTYGRCGVLVHARAQQRSASLTHDAPCALPASCAARARASLQMIHPPIEPNNNERRFQVAGPAGCSPRLQRSACWSTVKSSQKAPHACMHALLPSPAAPVALPLFPPLPPLGRINAALDLHACILNHGMRMRISMHTQEIDRSGLSHQPCPLVVRSGRPLWFVLQTWALHVTSFSASARLHACMRC